MRYLTIVALAILAGIGIMRFTDILPTQHKAEIRHNLYKDLALMGYTEKDLSDMGFDKDGNITEK